MKKFKVAALMMCFVAFSFAMTSCQKAEDLIVGKWKCTSATVDGRTSTESIGMIYEFNADNTFAMTYQGFSVSGTYDVSKDVLTVTMYGESTKMNIDKINKSRMVLSDPENPSDIAEFERQ